jgi:hypothetical protein
LQIGEQDVAFGAKFSARIVMDVEEVPEESLAAGTKEIEFRQLEGDFQRFDGVWRMEQVGPPLIFSFIVLFHLMITLVRI